MSFYITCPSNVIVTGRENLVNDFEIEYPEPLLDGEAQQWEMALTEFSYVHNFINIKDKEYLSIQRISTKTPVLVSKRRYYIKERKSVKFQDIKKKRVKTEKIKTRMNPITFKTEPAPNSLTFQVKPVKTKRFILVQSNFLPFDKDFVKTITHDLIDGKPIVLNFDNSKFDSVDITLYYIKAKLETPQIINVPSKYYTDINDFLTQLNLNRFVTFKLDDTEKKIVVVNKNKKLTDMWYYNIKFTSGICGILGADRTFKMRTEINYVGKHPYSLTLNIHYIYLYNNVTAHVHVGNTRAQVLKVIPVDTNKLSYGQLVSFTFNREDFIPLQVNSINKLSFQLRTDTGQLYPITHGRSSLSLHLRKHAG